MVQLPASECSADHRDSSGALGHTAPTYRGFIRPELRTGTLARRSMAARALAFQDSYCRRMFEAQRVQIEQGYREIYGASGCCTIHWSLVEPHRDACPEFVGRFVGSDVLYRFRPETET